MIDASGLGGASDDPDALYALAMRQRAEDRRAEAIAYLVRATELAAPHPALAHALARTKLEAGLPASADFERAIALAPGDGSLRLGLAAARNAEGHGAQALDELAALLAANPGWTEGHATFAQLSALAGQPERAMETLSGAAERAPDAPQMVMQAIDIALANGRHRDALDWADRGERRFGAAEAWTETRAIAWDDLGERDAAAVAFAALGEPDSTARAMRLVRHRMRTGAIDGAATLIDSWLGAPGGDALWPYAASVWRLTDPARAEWLDRGGALVAEIDLGLDTAELNELAALLRNLHAVSGQFSDQSVRGGTQTDGALFSRIEEPIARLRSRIAEAVETFGTQLPKPDPTHPTLTAARGGPVRFAGSWSVRLEGSGRHVAHHHPGGWISSAFYVALPSNMGDGDGVLELGRPPADLALDLPPQAIVVPRAGTLALFPSWMWHATTPFRQGERMTVAFDVAPA